MFSPRRIAVLVAILLGLAACGSEGTANVSTPPPPVTAPAPSMPPAVPDEIRFFAFGDWGTAGSDQKQVAAAVKTYCQSQGCDFGILLGDNFYPSGVSSSTDPQWRDKFENIYQGLNLPFYAVLGNHDHDGIPNAEVQYTALQNRWKMPAPQYTLSLPEGVNPPLLEIFVLDSVYGAAPDAATLDQLGSDLSNSQARWKILAFHHPLYSNGSHGDTVALRDALVPRICNEVDIALSGHDHLFSHLDDPNDGCKFQQWVIGTGGKDLYPTHPDPRAIYSTSQFGFGIFIVKGNALTVEFHLADGSLADSYTLNP